MADKDKDIPLRDPKATKGRAFSRPGQSASAPPPTKSIGTEVSPQGEVTARDDVEHLRNPEPDPKRETRTTQADGTTVPSNIASTSPQAPQPDKPDAGDEGEYLDPKKVQPNPAPEMHPNQRQPEPVMPRADLTPGTNHQVYPELHFGTTPTDPDIRHRDDGQTMEEQRAEMARRRSSAFPDEKVPIDQPVKEVEELRKREAPTTAPAPEPPKFKQGSLTTLKKDETYRILDGSSTAWWWKRKYDCIPEVTIEGKTQDIFGVPYGDIALSRHYLAAEFRDRTGLLAANDPVLKDHDKAVYIGTVFGRRNMVHARELETMPKD